MPETTAVPPPLPLLATYELRQNAHSKLYGCDWLNQPTQSRPVIAPERDECECVGEGHRDEPVRMNAVATAWIKLVIVAASAATARKW